MKTHKQDIEEFRQKFEKKRKWEFLMPILTTTGIFNIITIGGMVYDYAGEYTVIGIGRLMLISIGIVIVIFVVGILCELMANNDNCNVKLLKEQLSKE